MTTSELQDRLRRWAGAHEHSAADNALLLEAADRLGELEALAPSARLRAAQKLTGDPAAVLVTDDLAGWARTALALEDEQ